MVEFEKIVIITQKTWLDELVEKWNTKQQAKFYIEYSGGNYSEYETFHNRYYQALKQIKKKIPPHIKYHIVDKTFIPNFLFNESDLVLVLGRDGLVVNTAKYLNGQHILAVNPDPSRIEGVLLPFSVNDVPKELEKLHIGNESTKKISLAMASINNTSKIYGVNDLFIGHQSHQSARYVIKHNEQEERHSSSGIIVSTGLGSTGWHKSIITGVVNTYNSLFDYDDEPLSEDYFRMEWDADFLRFCVREPWSSKLSGSSLVYGQINKGTTLELESEMPTGGIIFSDGIESDNYEFNSGSTIKIGLGDKQVNLII